MFPVLQEPFCLCLGSSTRSLQHESSLSHWANTWAWTHCSQVYSSRKTARQMRPQAVCLCSPCWISIHPCSRSKEQFLQLLETTKLFVLTSEQKLSSLFLSLVCVWLQFSFLLEPFSCLQLPQPRFSLLMGSSLWKALNSSNTLPNCASAATALFSPMGSSRELTSGAGRTTSESEHLSNAD